MLLVLCLVISTIALIVGSVALSRDHRDVIIDRRSKSGKVNGLNSLHGWTGWANIKASTKHVILDTGASVPDEESKEDVYIYHRGGQIVGTKFPPKK